MTDTKKHELTVNGIYFRFWGAFYLAVCMIVSVFTGVLLITNFTSVSVSLLITSIEIIIAITGYVKILPDILWKTRPEQKKEK